MENLRHKGFTYTVYLKPRKKIEVIKYKTGYRNLWERSSISEYNKVKKYLKTKHHESEI